MMLTEFLDPLPVLIAHCSRFGELANTVGGHPAPELRGLHAWLAVHLPEFAPRLIEADPYGVLTYGERR
jgi:hypothetical protein